MARHTKAQSSNQKSGRSAAVAGLRVTDQETARVVCFRKTGVAVGAGCLVTATEILTCRHVIEGVLGHKPSIGNDRDNVTAILVGIVGQPSVTARVKALRDGPLANDLALLEIIDGPSLTIAPAEFAAPLRHTEKRFSVLGFPDGDPQGRNARGFLHAANAANLVQMDSASPQLVRGGFSGAPVWSADVGSFVGIVVTELAGGGIAWCVPSNVLCAFYPDLRVRFRVPLSDRPQINDYAGDDPNPQLFGTTADNGQRALSASVTWDKKEKIFVATAVYRCLDTSPPPRGGFVTFITHPSFSGEDEDAYELFARIGADRTAEVEFYPAESFTIAAIGDAGDTALTLDLSAVPNRPRRFR